MLTMLLKTFKLVLLYSSSSFHSSTLQSISLRYSTIPAQSGLGSHHLTILFIHSFTRLVFQSICWWCESITSETIALTAHTQFIIYSNCVSFIELTLDSGTEMPTDNCQWFGFVLDWTLFHIVCSLFWWSDQSLIWLGTVHNHIIKIFN